MITQHPPNNQWLEAVYKKLHYEQAEGWFNIERIPPSLDIIIPSWIEEIKAFGAETLCFIHGHPVILFFNLEHLVGFDTNDIEEKIRLIHIQVWNTSQVPLFYIALPTELRIYSAYQKPSQHLKEWNKNQRWLERIKHIAEISEQLQDFSYPSMTSGHLFYKRADQFRKEQRVDQYLLRNLRSLRNKLENDNILKREYIHSLIGRSIFVRYLEDRQILVSDYFLEQSKGNHECFFDYLRTKSETYKLFRILRKEFNGDIFPLGLEEEECITNEDVLMLRDFLMGKTIGPQEDLLFWAYKFNIIPIEFISSIYEEFYDEHTHNKDTGTHYTPTTLVDFVLEQTLTEERLTSGVRILDPACGSGVFLVEAFKRIVQFNQAQSSTQALSREKLTNLLQNHIVGIDINGAAIQIAAFSLYVALLDYLDPPDIRKHKGLPRLIYQADQPESGTNLYHSNVFYPTEQEKIELIQKTATQKRYKGRTQDLRLVEQPSLPIENKSFDIIIGNPPWGSDSTKSDSLSEMWCRAFDYTVGDKELAQSFMCRAETLLKPHGEIGLIVSTGVLFKHQQKSLSFRSSWLEHSRIRSVYNFTHVRDIFFSKQQNTAIAPFAIIFFTGDYEQREQNLRNRIAYITIKKTKFIEQLQVVVMDNESIKMIRQADLMAHDWLWKTYMWGNGDDVELISELKERYSPLQAFALAHGRGYQEGGGAKRTSTEKFQVNEELISSNLLINIPQAQLEESSTTTHDSYYFKPVHEREIHALGQVDIYHGSRLLIKRGITRQSDSRHASIIARLAERSFAFRNSIIGVRLDPTNIETNKVILGILRSSLALYYHFMTCSTWGVWRDEIHVAEHLRLPVNSCDDPRLINNIMLCVDQLIAAASDEQLFTFTQDLAIQEQLDEAIFDLYTLSSYQRQLVKDFCNITLDFFYNGAASAAIIHPSIVELQAYRDVFLEIWNKRLVNYGIGLETTIYTSLYTNTCGLYFQIKPLNELQEHSFVTDHNEWISILRRLEVTMNKPYTSNIYLEKTIKELGSDSIYIMKRAERRLWTKSQARQDARELLTQVFRMEWQQTSGSMF